MSNNIESRIFKMLTISKDLSSSYSKDVKKISIFSFSDGKLDFILSSQKFKKMIGTLENCWIRIIDSSNKYFDFITSKLYFDSNSVGVFFLVSEDIELISLSTISNMINSFIKNLNEFKMSNSQYIEKYTSFIFKEIEIANKELTNIKLSAKHGESSRLDIEDSFDYGRSKLIRKYLLNLISSKIIKDNKNYILEFVSS